MSKDFPAWQEAVSERRLGATGDLADAFGVKQYRSKLQRHPEQF
jgi:hypothetical protein